MTERRAIRLTDRFVEPRAFEFPWHVSAKGNPWMRAGNVVVVVSENKFHEGEWSVSFTIDGELDENNKPVWHRLPPPNRFTSQEDAKRAGLSALGVGRGKRDDPEPDQQPEDSPVADDGDQSEQTQRRIRVD